MGRRRKTGKKRTISPEQQEKMQAARKNAKIRRERVAQARDAGLDVFVQEGWTEQVLKQAERK